ncbi:MAG: hypothetical protein IKY92_03665 [Akkermansia sp.]|nr:hypothetical protein [Akkermansia sp.]
MTYQYQGTVTRYQFQTYSAPKPRKKNRKLARLLTTRKLLHFIGFLSFWATTLAITYLCMLVTLAAFVWLS